MNFNYTICNLSDGTEMLQLVQSDGMTEFGEDFFSGLWRRQETRRISLVRILLASGVALTLTVPQVFALMERRASQPGFSLASLSQTGLPALSYLEKGGPSVQAAAPPYFTLDHRGKLGVGEITQGFLDTLRSRGQRILPRVTYREAPGGVLFSTQAVDELVRLCLMHGFGELLFDIQGAELSQIEALAHALQQQMPDLKISGVVYPNREAPDYDRLNALYETIVLDATPAKADLTVSPYYSAQLVDKTVESGGFSGELLGKIVLGIPFGARAWGPGWDGSDTLNAREVAEICQRFAVREQFDPETGATYLSFTIGPSEVFYAAGRRMYGGDYTLNVAGGNWARQLLSLKNKYGLGGAAVLGAPLTPADLWDYYALWFGGGYFEDISSSYAKDDIMRAYVSGAMKGVEENRFAPYSPLTRAQAAVIAARLGGAEASAAAAPFYDIRGHWAEREITAAAESGLLKGYPDGSFLPDKPLTREETAALLARLTGLRATGASFTDVEGSWAKEEISALAAAGILKGYEDHTFRPTLLLSRQEMATLLARLSEEPAE